MNKLKINLPPYISDILTQLESSGFEAYVVGGCVRDALLNKAPNDWDICTSALPEQVKTSLSGYEIYNTGLAHGTVTAIRNKEICEITTFRTDGKYIDHRHPENVSFTRSLPEDLKRRDFTINAMAYNDSRGLVDIFGGQEDLKNGIIRCVGEPELRFDEDALRIIRALRFSACLGFSIEKKTKEAIYKLSHLLSVVANERIMHEFSRLVCACHAKEIIIEFNEIFAKLFSEPDILSTANILPDPPVTLSMALGVLLSKKSPEEAEKILRELRFEGKVVSQATFLIEKKDTPFYNDRLKIRKILSDFDRANSVEIFTLSSLLNKTPIEEQQEILSLLENEPAITFDKLALRGHDLLNLGIPSGKQIGDLFDIALDAVISEQCENKKADIINYLKSKNLV